MSEELTFGRVASESGREAATTAWRADDDAAVSSGGIMSRTRVNYWAVVVAAATTIVTSSVWYVVFGNAWLTLRGIDPSTADVTPEVWQVVGQLARNLVVAFVLACLLSRLETATWGGALRLGLLVWVGFQAMAVTGSVIHEDYPLGLYAIHVGDALQATLIMALILGVWRRETANEVDNIEILTPGMLGR
jgi:hypothetical protein